MRMSPNRPPEELLLPRDVHPGGKPLVRYDEMSNSYGLLYRQLWIADDNTCVVAHYRRQRGIWGNCSMVGWYDIYNAMNRLERD